MLGTVSPGSRLHTLHGDWVRRSFTSFQQAAAAAGHGEAAELPGGSRSTEDGAATLLASASMRITPGTMVHVEAPRLLGQSSGADLQAETGRGTAGMRTDIDVRVGADAETVSMEVQPGLPVTCALVTGLRSGSTMP